MSERLNVWNMDLVAYSDSDGSDAEPIAKVESSGPKSGREDMKKPLASKLVSPSNSRKIQVALPTTTQDGDHFRHEFHNDTRPSKRARTEGFSSNFNSLLPAPKNSSKQSLTPKSKARPSEARLDPTQTVDCSSPAACVVRASPSNARNDDDAGEVLPPPKPRSEDEEVKLVGRATVFTPLSVTRKPKKQKNGISTLTKLSETEDSVNSSKVSQAQRRTEQAAKKSLFSSFDEPMEDEIEVSAKNYTRVKTDRMTASMTTSSAPKFSVGDLHSKEPANSRLDQNVAGAQDSQSLQSLASSLSLTPSQRRQLFGRNAKDMALVPDAQVTKFSLAVEYSSNNEFRENEMTAPVQNPVRSIGSGKHSLQQLVNAATSQKDALEESFAAGKANKKGAGSKYGW